VKLHDLKPAPGSRRPKRRVGRGIAAGQGKTAGRGTKGQKARAGGKIPAWFEGGQTPLHQRIPKLRGFRNPFKVEYEVVNIGDIARLVELGELEPGDLPGGSARASKKGSAPITVNQEILRAAGLVRRLDRPMKVLGGGELSSALFVVADAFSASARTKIEGAGGTVSVLEVPEKRRKALGVDDDARAEAPGGEPAADAAPAPEAIAEAPADEAPAEAARPARGKRGAAKTEPDAQPENQSETKTASGEAASELTADEAAAVEAALAETAAAEQAPDESTDAPAKPRATRKPKTPKPDTDA
jgi:large subunit ribosomal protein L15